MVAKEKAVMVVGGILREADGVPVSFTVTVAEVDTEDTGLVEPG